MARMPSGESSSLSFPEGQHDGSEAQHDDSEGAWTNTRRSVGACDVDRAWDGGECGWLGDEVGWWGGHGKVIAKSQQNHSNIIGSS